MVGIPISFFGTIIFSIRAPYHLSYSTFEHPEQKKGYKRHQEINLNYLSPVLYTKLHQPTQRDNLDIELEQEENVVVQYIIF